MMRPIWFSFSAILLCAVYSLSAQGQEIKDTIPVPKPVEEIVIVDAPKAHDEPRVEIAPKEAKPFSPNSTTAVLCSIIPGGGQIYNRVYWKIPIVIGAYTACYYAITWNNNNLSDYATAFRDIKSDKPMENTSWHDFVPYGVNPETYVNNSSFHDQLRRGRDFYRRNRDLSIIITAAVYALFMIDSYVDAELYNFDISPNLTLSYTPAYMAPTPETPDAGIGVQFALTF